MENILSIALTIIASVGVSGIIVFGLSSWLGKVWANRLMQQEKAVYAQELEKLKSEFTQNLEQYKTQLKKSELLFEKQYIASIEFGNFVYSVEPDKEHVLQEWEDAARSIPDNFDKYKIFLNDFLKKYNILFDEKVIESINNVNHIIQTFSDDYDIHDMHDGNQQDWYDKQWEYGDKFYTRLKEAYNEIKESLTGQVEN